MSYHTEAAARAAFADAQALYDATLPPDPGPELIEVLEGTDRSRAATRLYDELDDAGRIHDMVDTLNDDMETRSALVRLVMRHRHESPLLAAAIKRLVIRMEAQL